jgi:hypothetical protein
MRFVLVSLCVSAGLCAGGCSDASQPAVEGNGWGDEGGADAAWTNDAGNDAGSSSSGQTMVPTGMMAGDGAPSLEDAIGSVAPAADSASSSSEASSEASNEASSETGIADSASREAGATGQAPTIGGCSIFPADNPWNTRVDDPQKFPVHANSATYIASMSPTTHLHADWGDWSTSAYGIPWQTVPGSQPTVPMSFDSADESDPGPYPFPPNALVEGGAGSGGDMHVLVLETGSCTLYETWSSTFVGPGWSCGSGAKFDLGSNGLRPDGWTSGDAAGLPILPGLVRVSEVKAGAIEHALRFTVSRTQQAFIHPATHAAGSRDTALPPMGLRLRLKASFSLASFSGAAKVILTAMQQYGLLLADNGGNWFVSGDSDDAWTPLMSEVNAAFGQVHGGDFEAVDTGPLQ